MVCGMTAQMEGTLMGPSHYSTLAHRYWQTYLPSQLATIPEADRDLYFRTLGEQVAQRVEEEMQEIWMNSTSPEDSPEVRAQRGQMAQLRARELVLEEMVYLPKEPGTEDRELPRPQSTR